MSFFENTRKPQGFGGKIMLAMMNSGHSAMAEWGFQFLNLPSHASVLDTGCGGGAFFICNESNGETSKDDKWVETIGEMTIYTGEQLRDVMIAAGFTGVRIEKNHKGFLCVTAQKA